MSCESNIEPRVGDVGTAFILQIRERLIVDGEIVDSVSDISTGTDFAILFRKPSGEVMEKVADLYTDGTDGKIIYITGVGDLDEVGEWKVEGKVKFTLTSIFYSNIKTFYVGDILS
jgi:hypothetical protein